MGSSKDGSSSNKSFVEGLKTEWSLFWQTILGDEEEGQGPHFDLHSRDPFLNGRIETLSLEKIKAITKALSQDRKRLNQRLESLGKELDLNSVKLDSLRLVGGETEDTEKKINELSDIGQALSLQLAKIDDRLRAARERERTIRQGMDFLG